MRSPSDLLVGGLPESGLKKNTEKQSAGYAPDMPGVCPAYERYVVSFCVYRRTNINDVK